MKKKLFLTLALALSVVTRLLAVNVNSGDVANSPKVGDKFTVTTGSAYTVTYTVTKAVSGKSGDASFTQGEVELTKFEFGKSADPAKFATLELPGYIYVYYNSPTISRSLECGGYTVTAIGENAFFQQTELTNLRLAYEEKEEPYLSIGKNAFFGCSKMYAIYINSNGYSGHHNPELGNIGEGAFHSTKLSMTVKTHGDVGKYAFQGSRIAQFTMYGHHTLDEWALSDCSKLSYIEIGGDKISKDAISNTEDALYVTWTGGGTDLKSEQESPFYKVRTKISSVQYKGSIPNYLFYGCTNLKRITSPSNLLYINGSYSNPRIGKRAFYNCTSLNEIQIGGFIDEDAFYGCKTISSIVWRGGDPYGGKEVSYLVYDAPFANICTQITSFKFESSPVATPAKGLCYHMTNLKEVTLPFMGSTLGDYLFAGCTGLETVTFDWGDYDSDKYTYQFELNKGVFEGCTSLKEVKNLPKCLSVVRSFAFQECTSLHRNPVTLNHKKLTTIESAAFSKSAIDTLYIPENVTKIGGGAYSGSAIIADQATNLKVIVYLPANLTRSQVSGSYLNLFASNLGGSGHSTEKVEAVYLNQANLTAIPDSMFMGWISLKGVYPMNATTLKAYETGFFPNLKTIGKAAFYYTTALENCRPLESSTEITKIDDYAFYKSGVSRDLYNFPKLTEIGAFAFAESGITSFAASYNGNANAKTDYTSSNLQKLTTIGNSAFKDCAKLTKVGFPYALKTMGTKPFDGCPVTAIVWAPANYSVSDPLTKAGIDKTKITAADIAAASVVPDEFLMGAPIKTLGISAYVEKLGKSAFAETASLDSVYINTPLSQQESTKDSEGPFYHSAVKKAQFGEMATAVAENLFGYALDLNWVDMPKVTTIGSRAFRDTKLKNVVLRDVTKIGEGAFYNFQNSYRYDGFTIYGKFVTDPDEVRMAFSKPGSSPRTSWAVYTVYGSCNTYTELLQNEGWKDMSSNISQLDDIKYTLEPNKAGIKQGEGTVDEDDSHYCEGYITLKAIPKEGYEFMYWFPQSTVKYYGEVDPTNPEITLQLEKYDWPYILAVFAKPDDFIDLTLNVDPADVGHIDIYNEIGIKMAEPKFLKDEIATLIPVSDNDWYQPASSCNFYENWIVDNENNFSQNLFNGSLCADITFNYQPMMGENPEDNYEVPDFPTQVTAKFVCRRVPVDIYTASNGGGTFEFLSPDGICYNFDENDPYINDSHPFRLGDKVLVVAKPNEGYKFSHWGNDKSNTKDTLVYTISMDNLYKEDMALNPEDMGSSRIKVKDANGNLEPFEQYGMYFVEVEGWFEQDNNYPQTKTYTITVESDDETQGSVSGSGTYEEGTLVTIKAEAKEGYKFAIWSDGELANPRVITVEKDLTLVASFVASTDDDTKYDLTVISEDESKGTVTGTGSYTEGQTIQISATPAEGYEFDRWSDGNTDNPRTITVTESETITAIFRVDDGVYTVTVTVNDEAMGSVIGGGDYNKGEEATLTAIANDGYVFDRWDDNVTINPRTFIVTKDVSLKAIFKEGSTALVETNDKTNAVKLIQNGQIYIIKDGKRYNLLGVRIE